MPGSTNVLGYDKHIKEFNNDYHFTVISLLRLAQSVGNML